MASIAQQYIGLRQAQKCFIMKNIGLYLFLISIMQAFGCYPNTMDYTHEQIFYKKETVDILVFRKKGEELKVKPVILFIQGSGAKPLIITDNEKKYPVFPFNEDILMDKYHLVIIGKPFIPIELKVELLDKNFNYFNPITKTTYSNYESRNNLDYYVSRNIFVLKYLRTKGWVSPKTLIVAGHSEGCRISSKMATDYKLISHLIINSGNPLGRIMSIIYKDRSRETSKDSLGEKQFIYWKEILYNKNNSSTLKGDTFKATYEYSLPYIDELERLRVPILICNGTKDAGAYSNDFLRVDVMRKHQNNFTFKTYINLEHNFFYVKNDGETDYSIYKWDMVVEDWYKWLNYFVK